MVDPNILAICPTRHDTNDGDGVGVTVGEGVGVILGVGVADGTGD